VDTCAAIGTVAIWNNSSGSWECSATLEGHENEVKCAGFSRSGLFLASCSRDKSGTVENRKMSPFDSLARGAGNYLPVPLWGGGGIIKREKNVESLESKALLVNILFRKLYYTNPHQVFF
jgi:WD40 repeat protein